MKRNSENLSTMEGGRRKGGGAVVSITNSVTQHSIHENENERMKEERKQFSKYFSAFTTKSHLSQLISIFLCQN
jgi:hypothetical protein